MTTKHTCGGPVFGKKTPGCPRCDELAAGAEPIQWAGARRAVEYEMQRQSLSAHFRSHKHLSGGCGPVCTFGDW